MLEQRARGPLRRRKEIKAVLRLEALRSKYLGGFVADLEKIHGALDERQRGVLAAHDRTARQS